MENISFEKNILICVIVDFGHGSKVLKTAKNAGVSGGTIFLGRGCFTKRLLEFLDLCDSRKEVVVMITEEDTGYTALEMLEKELHFTNKNTGIAFTIPIKDFFGSSKHIHKSLNDNEGEDTKMYDAIYTIVDKGKGEQVMSAAKTAGAKGGTIINARGTGIHETSKLFSMDIEPEKEIVLIICGKSKTDDIVNSVMKDLQIKEPGNGIIFILNVERVYGIREQT